MGKFEAALVGVMAFLILGILALIATSSDEIQTESVQSAFDAQTLLKEVESFSPESSSTLAVPAPGFEDVPEMIVREAPESESEFELDPARPQPESEPEVIEPTIVEVSLPPGTSAPGCEEENACYIPFLVSINVGDTVVWSNDDSAAHTVTSGTSSEGPDGVFDSSIFMSATTFEQTFSESGNYDYFCMVHPWMVGQIQVN